ncbi:MAG: ABC transporter ATP-binding protein [Candidatus Binatia bacterium]
MPIVLTAEDVSKRFYLRGRRPTTLRELATTWMSGRYQKNRTLWALRAVSFSVEKGEVFGIIGHNGAGKSTLLRLLSGLGQPTSGRIDRVGLVSALLELGSGFHPELTGRENILTAGLLNGLTTRQVRSGEEAIIAFAEMEDFIDEPVRTYSSGMYLRLAFAVATHFDPEILILDEVLAVGDARFQQKCLERLTAFRKAGKTLILTSHDAAQIETLCDEVLVLEEGEVVMQDDPESAVRCYRDLMRQRTEKRTAMLSGEALPLSLAVTEGSRQGTQEASISDVRFYDAEGRPTSSVQCGESLTVELEYRLMKPLPDMTVTLGIFNEAHVNCFEVAVPSTQAAFGTLSITGVLRCRFPELPLLAGRYYINVGLYPTDWDFVYDYHWEMHSLNIVSRPGGRSEISGVVALAPIWSTLAADNVTERRVDSR